MANEIEGADIVLEVERRDGKFIIRIGGLSSTEIQEIVDRLKVWATKFPNE